MKFIIKFIMGLIITTLSSLSYADSVSSDFSKHSSDKKTKYLSEADLRNQLELNGKVYVTSPDGETLYYEGPEIRKWKFARTGNIISYWSFESDEIESFALKQTWTLNQKGKIQVHIQQYDSIKENTSKNSKKPKLGKLLKEKKFNLKDFAPVIWEVSKNQKQRVVTHISPLLLPKDEAKTIGALPISAKGVMAADNKGKLWIQNASFNGRYIALTTYNGTVYLSYSPFKGSKEIGFAKNNRMKITLGKKHNLNILNSSPFLPNGMKAKVFGKINFRKKSASQKSLFIQSSSEEKEFLEVL